ncbi:putative Ni/Fe-hydrogenase 2 b-type cytochrome subunit [bacterium HR08]|nr:putative Ni/Fe-hydrogenase 2 b-type cytochrome subunit [bacterium HR08]
MKWSIRRPGFWRLVFLVILGAGLYSTIVRFTGGLGASTALSDAFPWGLWVGFDVLCGVALAAGGFTLSAVVYIFNIERFRPIVRPTILTAFLGYLLVIVALLFDLGRPYRIWHPLVMWNPHSVMFEVAWCVMLYTTVLALEFSPMVFERLRLERPLRILHALTVPLVILGVILSTLHQSSLGSLYLIVPEKLHPLWYSPLLPIFFFISAIALGCAMTIFESFLSYRAFRKRLEIALLADLGKVIVVALAVYLVLKVQDLAGRGALAQAFEPTYEARMFLAEMTLGVIGPMLLLSVRRIRTDHFGLFVSALLVVLGFIMNRLNVSITGMEASSGVSYFPSWTELSVTFMIVALGFALFGLAVKYLPIFPEMEREVAPPPAVAVLRRPWMGTTPLVLTLGGIFFVGALGLAYSGLLHRERTLASWPRLEEEEPNIAEGLERLNIPPDVTFPQGEGSLGPVTFRHASHIDWERPDCTVCHREPFRILKIKGSAPSPPARDWHDARHCGRCHDGKTSFSAHEECTACHQP